MVTFPHAGTHFKLWRLKKKIDDEVRERAGDNFTKKKWHGECRDIITQVEIFFSFLFPQTDIVMRTNEVSQSSLRITCWGYIAPEKGNCGNWSHSDDDEQGASGSSPFCLLLSLAHRLPPIVNPISTHLTAAADQTQIEVQRANIPASAAKKTASSACEPIDAVSGIYRDGVDDEMCS